MKIIMLFLMIISLVSISFAYNCEELVDDVIGKEVPAGIPYSNERFNIFIDGAEEGFIIVEDKNVTDAGCFIITEPTYNIQIDSWETVQMVTNSSNPIDTLEDLMDGNEIELEGIGFAKKVKAVFTEMLITVYSWFI